MRSLHHPATLAGMAGSVHTLEQACSMLATVLQSTVCEGERKFSGNWEQ